MQSLYSVSRDTIHSILLSDEILRFRTIVHPTNPMLDQYRHNYVNLLHEALRLRAWYCTRYLLSVTNLDYYNARVRSELLWSAILSGEPEMFEMAYTTDDALDPVGIAGTTIPMHLATQAKCAMALSLSKNWSASWRYIDWRLLLMHTQYSRNATIQSLMPMPRTKRTEICEKVLAQLRRSHSEDMIVQSSIEQNDWILLEYLEAREKPTLNSALNCLGGNATIPWPLHRAAAANSGKAIDVLCDLIDINMIDDHGNTMLHIAARCGNVTTVEFLLEAGANAMLQNQERQCVLQYLIGSACPSLRCAALIAGRMPDKDRFQILRESWFSHVNESMRQMIYDPAGFEMQSRR